MYCIRVDIPQSLCEIDDELKAIYHGKDTVCIWVFKTKDERNEFVNKTAGMLKAEREDYYKKYFTQELGSDTSEIGINYLKQL